MGIYAWFVFVICAGLEVSGDAAIRAGMRGRGAGMIAAGFVTLGCYGLLVNTVKWDFSRLLGAYVAVFALMAVVTGRIFFSERVPAATWLGLILIFSGAALMQWK